MNARLFEELRPVGFAVAYRMLGSVSEGDGARLQSTHDAPVTSRIRIPRKQTRPGTRGR